MAYPKTLTALQGLQNALTCTHCQNLSSTLCTLGACEHLFCRACCNSLLGTCCPQCKIPVHVKDAQVNRQLSNLVSLCQELGRILVSDSQGDGVTTRTLQRDEDLSIREVQESTPETVQQQKSHALSGAVLSSKQKGQSMGVEKQTEKESGKNVADIVENIRKRRQSSRSTRLRHASGEVTMNDGNVTSVDEMGQILQSDIGVTMTSKQGNSGRKDMMEEERRGRSGGKQQKKNSVSTVKSDDMKRRGGSRSRSRNGRGRSGTREDTVDSEQMHMDSDEGNDVYQHRNGRRNSRDSGRGTSQRGMRKRCSITSDKGRTGHQEQDNVAHCFDESAESESDVSHGVESDVSDDSGYTVTKRTGRKSKSKGKVYSKTRSVSRKRKQKVLEKPADQSTMTQFYEDESENDTTNNGEQDGSGSTKKKVRGGTRKRQGTSNKADTENGKRSRTKETEKPANQSTMTQFYEYDDDGLPLLEMPGETDVKNTTGLPKGSGRESRCAVKDRPKTARRGRSKDHAPQEEIGTPCSSVSDVPSVGSYRHKTSGKKQGKGRGQMLPTSRTSPQKRVRWSLGGSQGEGQVKRNARGETPLHVAAIKGDAERVKILLESGAKPNVRDNAGWTPLHECSNHGYTTIVELLLDHGAMMNTPGMENDTPLHDAVSNYRLDVVRLLVSRGASVSARNIHGKTPLDLAQTAEMRQALDTPISQQINTADESVLEGEEEFQSLCFLGTTLSRDDGSKLQKCASVLHAKVVDAFTPEVSHLITSCNKEGQCPRTLKYLHAVLSGKWVVSVEWLDLCIEYKQKVCEEAFEVPGSSTNPDSQAATKGRLNRRQQLPGLFDGCQFYFHGTFHSPTPEKEELLNLVKSGGGKILTREPKLHNIDDYYQTVPYHAERTSVLKDCGLFIVHDKNVAYPAVNASRLCVVTANWIMDCIASFSLVDPAKRN